jgi:hypothetical protein
MRTLSTRSIVAGLWLTAVTASADAAAPAGAQLDSARLFQMLDANRDGQLSKDEFKKLATLGQGKYKDRPEVFDQVFTRLDADGNRALSAEEFKGLTALRGWSGPPSSPIPTPAPAPQKADAVKPASTPEKNRQLGTTEISYVDPEFLGEQHMVVFQDGSDNSLWVGKLDPVSGLFITASGKDMQVERRASPILSSMNGPEFGIDNNGWSVFFTKPESEGSSVNQIWKAVWNGKSFETSVLTTGRGHQTAVASKNSTAENITLLALEGTWQSGDAVWFTTTHPEKTEIFIEKRPPGANAEMIPGTSKFVTSIPDKNNIRQLYIIDSITKEKTQITSGQTDMSGAWAWVAPDFNNTPMLVAVADNRMLKIWQLNAGGYTDFATYTPAGSSLPKLKSPEAFVVNGRSFICFSAHPESGKGGQIWLYEVKGAKVERCDDGGDSGRDRLEPEPYVSGEKSYLFYSVRNDARKWELWRYEPDLFLQGVEGKTVVTKHFQSEPTTTYFTKALSLKARRAVNYTFFGQFEDNSNIALAARCSF